MGSGFTPVEEAFSLSYQLSKWNRIALIFQLVYTTIKNIQSPRG